MIPLRDDVPSRTLPAVNYALIALKVAAFSWELGLGRDLERGLARLAAVPVLYAGGDGVFGLSDLVVLYPRRPRSRPW